MIKAKIFLLNLPRLVKRVLVILLDILTCALSIWLAFVVRLEQWFVFQKNLIWPLMISIILLVPIFSAFGLYTAINRYIGSAVFVSLVRAFSIYMILFFCVFTLIGVDGVPRSIGFIQPILLFVAIGALRYFVRYSLGAINSVQSEFHKPRSLALIYGAGNSGRQLASSLKNSKEILIKGFVDDDLRLQGSTLDGCVVYSGVGLQDLIHQLNITDILLAIPSASQSRRKELIASLSGCKVRVRTLPRLMNSASEGGGIAGLQDLDTNDLLGRQIVPPHIELLEKNIKNQVVLVTGAGGSIGSEICRQVIRFSPKSLILVDSSEQSLHLIFEELKSALIGLEVDPLDGDHLITSPRLVLQVNLVPCLASVRDRDLLLKLFGVYKPTTVFHAAAYKHVPLVEQNPIEGIRNNVFGTLACVQVSIECGVSNFILISTDKAVRPTNIMGASKRIAELILQAMADIKGDHLTNFSIVRFGNVLGSSGSVVPLFRAQIAAGGPITLTHPEVTRYFMTIPEAAQLVIQASSLAIGGDVFVLDMGEPVRIYDLAVKMVYLSGLLVKDENHPNGDIEIEVTGLRPGEKLYEELLIGDSRLSTAHPKIIKAHEEFLSWSDLHQELEKLNVALGECDDELIGSILRKLVPGYQPNSNAAC